MKELTSEQQSAMLTEAAQPLLDAYERFISQRHNHFSIIESDVPAHIEDTPLVNAVRDGKLVQVAWNQLTEGEQRQARAVMFDLRFEVDWY